MKSKIFEVRAPSTLLVVLATRLGTDNEAERYLLGRSGYGTTSKVQSGYIMLQLIDGNSIATTDPYKHNGKEMYIAHQYIRRYFDALEEGSVIDVEFITGITDKPKIPERIAKYMEVEGNE